MANFIRVGNRFLNLEQIIDVWVATEPGGTTVEVTTTELYEDSEEDGRIFSQVLMYTGEEAEALAAFFVSMAPDVLALHGTGQAEQEAPLTDTGFGMTSLRWDR